MKLSLWLILGSACLLLGVLAGQPHGAGDWAVASIPIGFFLVAVWSGLFGLRARRGERIAVFRAAVLVGIMVDVLIVFLADPSCGHVGLAGALALAFLGMRRLPAHKATDRLAP